MSYLEKKVKVHNNTRNEKKKLSSTVILIVILIGVLVLPFVVSVAVYKLYFPLPGEPGEWFGFLGSYIGVVASVFIAFFTWENSGKLDDMNSMLLHSAIGFNVRFVDFIIYPVAELFSGSELPPCYVRNVKEGKKYNQYKIILKFVSKNKIAVKDIKVKRVKLKIGEIGDNKVVFEPLRSRTEQDRLPSKMCISEDLLNVSFRMGVETETEEERKLSQFYFYFSQFSDEYKKIDISFDMEFSLEHNRFVAEGDKKSSIFEKEKDIKVYNITLDAEFQMLPEFNERPFYNKTQINKYEINPTNFDGKKLSMIDTGVNRKRNRLQYQSIHMLKQKKGRFHYKNIQKWKEYNECGRNDCLERTEMKLESEKK